MHVKRFTVRHPGVPRESRGTYANLSHEAAIAHGRHTSGAGNTFIRAMPRGSRAITMNTKTEDHARQRKEGEPWPRHLAPGTS